MYYILLMKITPLQHIKENKLYFQQFIKTNLDKI